MIVVWTRCRVAWLHNKPTPRASESPWRNTGAGEDSTDEDLRTSADIAGQPEVLYVRAEYRPYCVAERWAVAAALSRFGTLHGVGETTSSPTDVYPSTNTLSFHGSTYTGPLPAFVSREIQSNHVVDGHHAPLDKLTSTRERIMST